MRYRHKGCPVKLWAAEIPNFGSVMDPWMAQDQLTRLNCPWQILLMRFHVNLCVFPQHSFYACLCHISSFPPTAYQVLPPKDTKGCQRHVHVHRTSFARAHQRRSARLGASINLESSVDISEFTIVTVTSRNIGSLWMWLWNRWRATIPKSRVEKAMSWELC
jgi:hypothetical protein